MPKFIELLGQQTAGTALGEVMGFALGGLKRKAQVRQQRRMQNLQIEGNKEMMDYQQRKELEMWEKTGYGAQKDQLKAAGLNPGLLYGMGGAGGQTVGGTAGTVSGGRADEPMGIQMGNTALLAAQAEVLKSQARLNNVEADKKSGVDTAVGEQGIKESQAKVEDISQGIKNKKAQEALMRVEEELKQFDLWIKGESQNDILATIKYTMRKIWGEANTAESQGDVDKNTIKERIKMAQQRVLSTSLEQALTRAITDNTKIDTKLKDQMIEQVRYSTKKMASDIMLSWDQLSNEQRRVKLQEVIHSDNMDWRGVENVIDIVENVVDGVLRTPSTAPQRNPVGFK